jgi:hypothetical protein
LAVVALVSVNPLPVDAVSLAMVLLPLLVMVVVVEEVSFSVFVVLSYILRLLIVIFSG